MRLKIDKFQKLIRANKEISLVVFAVFLFLVFLLIFLRILGREMAVPGPINSPTQKVEIDFDVLQDPIFKELENLEDIELPQEIGRENPFVPY